MMNEQDSSSGIVSDDHTTQHSSPTFSTFKDHSSPNISTASAAIAASVNSVINGGGGGAKGGGARVRGGGVGKRRHRIAYQETDLDDLTADPHLVIASAVEEDSGDEDSADCGRNYRRHRGQVGEKTRNGDGYQQQQQHSDYASDTSDTLRTGTTLTLTNQMLDRNQDVDRNVDRTHCGVNLVSKGAVGSAVLKPDNCNVANATHASNLTSKTGFIKGRNSVSVASKLQVGVLDSKADDYNTTANSQTVTTNQSATSNQTNQSATSYQNNQSATSYQNNQSDISYFDLLPDHAISRIFASLSSSESVTRCSGVCRRWYSLAWDPTLWTSIRINNSGINVDRALRSLTRRLSYDTPTVCVCVEKLNLSGCRRLTDRGLLTVARRCPELRALELQACPGVTNIALFEVVSRCVNLEHLNVAGCPSISCLSLTPEAALQAQTYTTAALGGLGGSVTTRGLDLAWLDMTDCPLLDAPGLQLVAAHCPRLQNLYLRRCTNVTDPGIQYVATYCTELRELSIGECPKVSDFGVKELARLGSSLRYLSASKCTRVSDFAVVTVARSCPRLRYLNVRGCAAVSDSALEALAQHCKRLKSLDVGKCDVTDDGLTALAVGCGHLRRLSLKGCEGVTDHGLSSLAYHCPQLQHLNIQQCHLSVEGYRVVKRNCKNCIIEHTNPGFF